MKLCATCGDPIPVLADRVTQEAWRKYCSRKCWYASRPRTSAAERLWRHVDKTETCWLWTGATAGPMKYGVIGLDREHMAYAHRVSWEIANGPIPPGASVLHRCDTPRCVRPDHLFTGTHLENMADMKAKGRAAKRPGVRGSANPNAKLTAESVIELRSSEESHKDAAARFGVTPTLVRAIRARRAWAWLE